jgi:hypothetical protein
MKHTMTDEERREAKRAYMRAYQKANPEKFRGYRAKQDKAEKAAYMRAYHTANKARIEEKARAWRAANKEKLITERRVYKNAHRDKINGQERARYHEQKDLKREQWKVRWTRNNRKRPALNLAHNESLLGRKKPDACEVCGGNDGGIVFDHCHKRNHARGWLCDRCNCALGFVKDDIDRLRKLIAYLERNRESTAPQLALAGI